MNHKILLAGVATAAMMVAGNAFAGAHASVEDQLKAQGAALDALSKEVEALKAGGDGPTKGVKGVDLKLSGHVNRAVSLTSDGAGRSKIDYVDSDASSTRVRWDASSKGSGITVGSRLEVEFESNNALFVDAQGGNNDGADDTGGIRHAYVFVKGGFGQITTGQQGEATEGILHSSFNFASLADINPEFTTGVGFNGAVASTPGVNFISFGDGGRQDSIRYDTPNFGGAKASISFRDNGEMTAAIRYSGKIGGIGALAALGYEENFGNQNIAFSGGLNFGPVALNLAGALRTNEGAGANDDFFWYVGLAHRGNYSSMGATSIAIDFLTNNGQIAGGENNSAAGIGIVQGIAPGADAYASLRHHFGADGNAVDSAQTALVGVRLRF